MHTPEILALPKQSNCTQLGTTLNATSRKRTSLPAVSKRSALSNLPILSRPEKTISLKQVLGINLDYKADKKAIERVDYLIRHALNKDVYLLKSVRDLLVDKDRKITSEVWKASLAVKADTIEEVEIYSALKNELAAEQKVERENKLSDSMPSQESIVLAQKRLTMAIKTVLKKRQALSVFKKKRDEDADLPVVDTTLQTERSLLFVLKLFQKRSDEVVNLKIKTLLTIPLEIRTLEDSASLERLIVNLFSFSRYSIDQRIKFCNCLYYELQPAGSVMVREGHSPFYYYFILSGQCEVYQKRANVKYRINILNAGDSFGDISAHGLFNTVRAASISCILPSEFLRVEKEEYHRIIRGQDTTQEIISRGLILRVAPLFKGLSSTLFEEASMRSNTITFDSGAVILKEGGRNDSLYFILSGSVKLLKVVPITKSRRILTASPSRLIEKSPASKSRYAGTAGVVKKKPMTAIQRPYTCPANLAVLDGQRSINAISTNSMRQKVEETVHQHIFKVNELSVGDSFPELAIPDEAIKCGYITNDLEALVSKTGIELDGRRSRLFDIQSKFARGDLQSEYPAYCSIVATSLVKCLVIKRLDFSRVASLDMVRDLQKRAGECYVKVEVLRQLYKEGIRWTLYKRQVSAETIRDSRPRTRQL